MLLQPGESAPWFVARSTSNERYHFDTVAGRCVVLCFVRSAALPNCGAVLRAFYGATTFFDDQTACFFAVSCDPADEACGRVTQVLPGYRVLWDFDRQLSELYGATGLLAGDTACTIVLDERLRVLGTICTADNPSQHVRTALALVTEQTGLLQRQLNAVAPVLIVPRVFEPEFCEKLIAYYTSGDPARSGFMQERAGMTVNAFDDAFKRRKDCVVDEPGLRMACRDRLVARLKPQIHRAFQFEATYAERYIVACYSSSDNGFFRPHRDNTTRGTAHRRFAVTINLNTGEYEGGELRFPEYGRPTYEAPLGGAIVFSCSLLHEATPVTKGDRYAFLPFLYDAGGAQLREANLRFVAPPPP